MTTDEKGLFEAGNEQAQPDPSKATAQSKAVAVMQKNIADSVLAKVQAFQQEGSLTLPSDYAVENHLKAAWLVLLETKDRNNNEALKVCTKESVATALLDMVLQGMSVSKKQGYFIVYGNKLTFMRSYFGTISLAKKVGMTVDPVANVVYEKDAFEYVIDADTGLIRILKHDQKLGNIDNTKIVGAYCIVHLPGDRKQITIMTMDQIKRSWEQGATKGNSPAHKGFAEEMAKRTVINKALKQFINSSGDSWLYADKRDEMDTDTAAEERNAKVASGAGSRTISAEEVEYEEVRTASEPAPETESRPEQADNAPSDEEPPYAQDNA